MPSSSEVFEYQGSELELFADAKNWRAYWQKHIAPFVGATVLEVGAGIGTVTRDLARSPIQSWVALEPDPILAARIEADCREGRLPSLCTSLCGTTAALGPDDAFDTIIYIDVLEHIEDDHAELARAARHLKPGGYLIVLVPAYQALYTAFDASIGHFRRYSMAGLLGAGGDGMRVCLARYLDSVGLLASLGNKLLLRSAQPTRAQVRFWDRLLVPVSRWLDPIIGYRFGKSAVAVWQRKYEDMEMRRDQP